jgi:hypothetical protein
VQGYLRPTLDAFCHRTRYSHSYLLKLFEPIKQKL